MGDSRGFLLEVGDARAALLELGEARAALLDVRGARLRLLLRAFRARRGGSIFKRKQFQYLVYGTQCL